VLVLAPYLLLTRALWHVQRLVSREDPANEIAPGLWLGRWPRRGARELPPDTGLIVDLAAELAVASDLRRSDGRRTFFALPTLDASTPEDPVVFDRAVRAVAETLPSTPVYVHCALGHGRSALLVAAVLLARGAAASAEEAEARVQAVRPGVALNKAQRRFLSDWWAGVGTKQHDNSR
jgi:protein-tyrosine phosphatase